MSSVGFAPAKINLLLKVFSKRADGYHNLLTLFQLISLHDEIEVEEAVGLEVSGPPSAQAPRADAAAKKEGSASSKSSLSAATVKIAISGPYAGPMLQTDSATGAPANILWRAYELMSQEAARHNIKLPPLKISLRKNIPVGAGLGGGSSDAACLLNLIRRRWLPALPAERLLELAAQLGADVPVFVGGRSAWGEGIGEQLTPAALPPRYYLLCCPRLHCSTAEVFAALAERRAGDAATDISKNPAAITAISKTPATNLGVSAAATDINKNSIGATDISKNPAAITDISKRSVDEYLTMSAAEANDLFAPACHCHPQLAELHKQLNTMTPNKLGAQVFLSGSGGTLFAVYDDECKALADQQQLERSKNQPAPAAAFALPLTLHLVRGLKTATELNANVV